MAMPPEPFNQSDMFPKNYNLPVEFDIPTLTPLRS